MVTIVLASFQFFSRRAVGFTTTMSQYFNHVVLLAADYSLAASSHAKTALRPIPLMKWVRNRGELQLSAGVRPIAESLAGKISREAGASHTLLNGRLVAPSLNQRADQSNAQQSRAARTEDVVVRWADSRLWIRNKWR